MPAAASGMIRTGNKQGRRSKLILVSSSVLPAESRFYRVTVDAVILRQVNNVTIAVHQYARMGRRAASGGLFESGPSVGWGELLSSFVF